MKFRKRPVEVEASQWFKNGDHPKDDCEWFQDDSQPTSHPFLGEGKVVRYFKEPNCSGKEKCHACSFIMHQHGWIDTFEGGHIVCPGDWIITGVRGERYPCKPDIFQETYEKAE